MNLAGFIRGRWSWAKQKPLFWGNLALLAITLQIIFAYPGPITDTGPSDIRLRIWGMFLQLLGAYTVWHDLTRSARAFGKGGFLKSTWEWLKKCLGARHIVSACATGSIGIIGGRARVTQRRSPPADVPIDARLEALEFNLARIDDDLSAALREIDENTSKYSTKLSEERQAREAAVRALESRLQDAIVGNFTVLAFGALWVVVGIVISTLAPEIVKVVAGQWTQVWTAM